MALFKLFLPTLLAHEGGYVDHPLDPGGATKYGIILTNWMKYGRDVDNDGDIDKEDLKKITPEDAAKIYKDRFWDKIRASEIVNQDVANIVFDMYVNATSIAIPLLQYILNQNYGKNLAIDGAIGPKTLEAVNSVNAASLHDRYKAGRLYYYNYRADNLPASDPYYSFFKSLRISPRADQQVFLKGWLKRALSFADKKKRH